MPSYAKFAEPYTVHLPAPLKWLGRCAVRGAERAIFDGWLKPKILGRGNVPANRNFIVVANHSSHLDFSLVGYALGAIGDDLRVLAAKDYFFNTPARRFLAVELYFADAVRSRARATRIARRRARRAWRRGAAS